MFAGIPSEPADHLSKKHVAPIKPLVQEPVRSSDNRRCSRPKSRCRSRKPDCAVWYVPPPVAVAASDCGIARLPLIRAYFETAAEFGITPRKRGFARRQLRGIYLKILAHAGTRPFHG